MQVSQSGNPSICPSLALVAPQVTEQFEGTRGLRGREMPFNDHIDHIQRKSGGRVRALLIQRVSRHNRLNTLRG